MKIIQLLMKYIVSLILIGLVFALFSCERIPVYKQPAFDGKSYVIYISAMKENVPDFYTVTVNNTKVNFFVILVNGEVGSYFDACRKCYPHKLGFRSDNGTVLCKYCDIRYSPEALKGGMGSCYPIHLKGTLADGKYLIGVEALSAGEKLFQ